MLYDLGANEQIIDTVPGLRSSYDNVYFPGVCAELSGTKILTSINYQSLFTTLPFIYNKSARYDIQNLLNKSKIVFGNKSEYKNVYKKFEETDNIKIITDGAESVEIYADCVKKISCEKIDENEIVDTTGAGDIFVAGFLNSFIFTKNFDKSIEKAIG